jgi:uncharacterized protein (DUF362 family)
MNKPSDKYLVSIVKYEKPLESVRRAVEFCRGLENISPTAKVFIKPNVVFWTQKVRFPKWGVITTSRVIEDMVILLRERGIGKIAIGEGMVTYDPKDTETPRYAFDGLGYNVLNKRYGVQCININERPFDPVDVGEGVRFNVSRDVMESDFVVNIPVLKTHAQTIVSLGIKNLKGTLDIKSRKQSHSADKKRDLNYMVSKLARLLPHSLTVLDGIYTNERGPAFDGRIRRMNILAASLDLLSADMVGARLLGHDISEIPHIALAAKDQSRPTDLSDVSISGEKIADLARPHKYAFPYTEDRALPLPMKRMGIQGLTYRQYDLTLCTYCSYLTIPLLDAVVRAWKGEPWDDVEILTGKSMEPTPGKRKTILFGKCIYQAQKDNPHIREMIAIKGCPPGTREIVEAFHRAGIDIDPATFEEMDKLPGLFMKKYEGKPDFDESLFQIR